MPDHGGHAAGEVTMSVDWLQIAMGTMFLSGWLLMAHVAVSDRRCRPGKAW
jgi:hypothetical protein